jgi:hypothetical protein
MMSSQKSENLLTVAVIGAWITLWWAVFYGFNALSFNGYFPHFVETEISVQPDWLVGEVKECSSPVLNRPIAHDLGKKNGYVAEVMYCDDGPKRAMNVTLFGRLEQPEHRWITWKCRRDATGFTCHQTGAK